MTDTTTYIFKIADFTPESRPFGRLVEYYVEIKRMLGVADNMHLVDVVESSHGSTFKVDRACESSLTKRLMEINRRFAPPPFMRAHDAINAMLKEDGTSGLFSDSRSQNVIKFPGRLPDASTQVRVRGAASFTGELYHIVGTRGDAKRG